MSRRPNHHPYMTLFIIFYFNFFFKLFFLRDTFPVFPSNGVDGKLNGQFRPGKFMLNIMFKIMARFQVKS